MQVGEFLPNEDAPNIKSIVKKNYADNNFGGDSVTVAEVIGGGCYPVQFCYWFLEKDNILGFEIIHVDLTYSKYF